MNKPDYSLYLVTDTDMCKRENLLDVTEKAIKGGVTMVQLREKDISSREFYTEAIEMKKLCQRYSVPLIINDRMDIALAADADGLHIGQSDIPIDAARKVMGENKIIGVSAGNVTEAKTAVSGRADYLGVGAVFHTDTKKDAVDVGLNMLRKVRESVDIPLLAIGGINHSNIDLLKNSGIDGVAVVSCIMASDDPYAAAVKLSKKVECL